MRIHTNANFQDILTAISESRTYGVRLSEHKSRTHARAFDVKLEGDSRRRPNGGAGFYDESVTGHAATWDQWGVFLASIYRADPMARSWAYRDACDFNWRTAHRFAEGWPSDAHGDHTFRWQGVAGEQRCTKCSAAQRWPLPMRSELRSGLIAQDI